MGNQSKKRRAKLDEGRDRTRLFQKARLYDRIEGHGRVDAVISVDNVETYCFENGKVFESWKQFPIIKPPFDELFVDCSRTRQTLLRNVGVGSYGAYMKVLDTSKHSTLLKLKENLTLSFSRVKDVGEGGLREFVDFTVKSVLQGASHLIHLELYGEWFGDMAQLTQAYIPIDETGAYTKTMVVHGNITVHQRCVDVFNPNWRSKDGNDFATEFIHSMYSVVFMGMSLAHCKNVDLIERVPSTEDSQQFEAVAGVPLTKYHVLAIHPLQDRSPKSDKPQQQFDIMPLHIRRGNFAHYTADAPLFGKYIGTFWRPATTVGSEKNGIVIKDYEVKSR